MILLLYDVVSCLECCYCCLSVIGMCFMTEFFLGLHFSWVFSGCIVLAADGHSLSNLNVQTLLLSY